MTTLEDALKYVESIEVTIEEHPSGENRRARFALQAAGRALSNTDNPCVADCGRRVMKLAVEYYGPESAFGQFSSTIGGWCAEMRMEISATQRHFEGES